MEGETTKSEIRMAGHLSPGPNKYMLPPVFGFTNHDVTVKRSPAYSLGGRFPEPGSFKKFTPASSTYHFPGVYRHGTVKLKGGMLGAKIDRKETGFVPAANTYFPDYKVNSVIKAQPAFSLGKKPYEQTPKLIPGSNNYFIPDTICKAVAFKKTSPAYSQLGRPRERETLELIPSPLEYTPVNCDQFKRKPPEFTIKGKKRDPTPKLIPAANTYMPTFCNKKSIPAYYFGVYRKSLVPKFSLESDADDMHIEPYELEPGFME